MTNAGLTPGKTNIDWSYGDDFSLVFTITGLTLGTSATLIVRDTPGDGGSTLLTFTVANGKITINSGTGTVTVTETKANMTAAIVAPGRYPYWLQVADSGGNDKTLVSGEFVALEAHQT